MIGSQGRERKRAREGEREGERGWSAAAAGWKSTLNAAAAVTGAAVGLLSKEKAAGMRLVPVPGRGGFKQHDSTLIIASNQFNYYFHLMKFYTDKYMLIICKKI